MGHITIRLGNAWSKLETDRTELERLDNELAVEDPGAFWARQRRPGWDGFWHFVDMVNGKFPTGLAERVKKMRPIDCDTVDARVRPPTIPFNKDILRGIEFADHQRASILKILEKGIGTVATSVGSGKTEQGIGIACHVHGLCVWLTHRRDLMHQTAERILWRTGSEAAKIGDGIWDDVSPKTKFLVGMPQTILTDMDTFRWQTKDANVMIVDECHTASAANDWYNVSLMVPSYYRVGLTGTPDIGDPVRERRLEAATGEVVIRIRSGEMAKIGWVAPARVHYHKVHNQAVHGVTYMDARRILIEENPERNAMIIELAMKEARSGKRCLIICDTVKHAKIISEVLAGESVRSRFLYGGHSSAARNEAKKEFKSGALEIVITTPIWDLGVDIPEIETVILAAGGKSAVRVIQRCGRALRTSKGKTLATIHDFFDTGSRYTMRHSEARMKACRDEGFEIAGELKPKPTAAPQR
jgi:superfamily II DNA or RNA helicase